MFARSISPERIKYAGGCTGKHLMHMKGRLLKILFINIVLGDLKGDWASLDNSFALYLTNKLFDLDPS